MAEEADKTGAGRVRLIIDTTDAIRQAVQLRALKLSVQERRRLGNSDVVNAILEEALAEELAEVQQAESPAPPPPPDQPKRRGRKKGE